MNGGAVVHRGSAGPWLGLVALSLAWGTAFFFTEIAIREIAPAHVVFGRIVFAAIALNALRRAKGLPLPRDLATWLRLVPPAVTGTVLPFLLVSWGQERVPSGLAGILMTATPLATAALAHATLAGEAATQRTLAGLLLGVVGVAVLLDPGALLQVGGSGSMLRELAILGGALCYAVNTVLARRFVGMHALVYGSCLMSIAIPLAAVQAAVAGPGELAASPAAFAAVVWLGLVPTGAATLVHYRIVSTAGATFASLTSYLIPFVALLAGAILLGEALTARAGLALALILLGVFLTRSGPPRPRQSGIVGGHGSLAARSEATT